MNIIQALQRSKETGERFSRPAGVKYGFVNQWSELPTKVVCVSLEDILADDWEPVAGTGKIIAVSTGTGHATAVPGPDHPEYAGEPVAEKPITELPPKIQFMNGSSIEGTGEPSPVGVGKGWFMSLEDDPANWVYDVKSPASSEAADSAAFCNESFAVALGGQAVAISEAASNEAAPFRQTPIQMVEKLDVPDAPQPVLEPNWDSLKQTWIVKPGDPGYEEALELWKERQAEAGRRGFYGIANGEKRKMILTPTSLIIPQFPESDDLEVTFSNAKEMYDNPNEVRAEIKTKKEPDGSHTLKWIYIAQRREDAGRENLYFENFGLSGRGQADDVRPNLVIEDDGETQ